MQIKFRYKAIAGALLFLSGALAFRGCSHATLPPAPSQVLPSEDLATVSVIDHKVTTTTKEGAKTQYVPNEVNVEITKTGMVNVKVKEMGLEHRFFFGLQADTKGRFIVGLDLFYFNRLDLGAGFGDAPGMYTPIVFAKASWVVWQQLQAGLTYSNLQQIGLALTLKF